jgi:transposase
VIVLFADPAGFTALGRELGAEAAKRAWRSAKRSRRAGRSSRGELMLLPSCSHDLNPIEQVFAKLKALLREAAPRTREAPWRTIGEKLSMLTPAECRNHLRHCGYRHPA